MCCTVLNQQPIGRETHQQIKCMVCFKGLVHYFGLLEDIDFMKKNNNNKKKMLNQEILTLFF